MKETNLIKTKNADEINHKDHKSQFFMLNLNHMPVIQMFCG